jgi:hypothetical protein
MAAHAACADAALADDAHWDAVSAGTPPAPDEPDAGPGPGTAPARRSGCLALVAMLVVVTAASGLLAI